MNFTNSHPFACRVCAITKARVWCEGNLNKMDWSEDISINRENNKWVISSMFNFRYEADLLVFKLANYEYLSF